MSEHIKKTTAKRYSSPVIVNHLASNYVIGLLNPKVRKRVDALRQQADYHALDERISYWENKLSPLAKNTAPLAPEPKTWQSIQTRLDMGSSPSQPGLEQTVTFWQWISLPFSKLTGAFALVICLALGASLLQNSDPLGPISYIAVLQDSEQSAQVVASTYGNSKQLVLDIISLPTLSSEQSFELWATSKTDKQTRSLGAIPAGGKGFNRELSNAEWRLIAGASHLIISVEDAGGSAIGEPSDRVVSKGVCVRLNQQEA